MINLLFNEGEKTIDWPKFREAAVALLESFGSKTVWFEHYL